MVKGGGGCIVTGGGGSIVTGGGGGMVMGGGGRVGAVVPTACSLSPIKTSPVPSSSSPCTVSSLLW